MEKCDGWPLTKLEDRLASAGAYCRPQPGWARPFDADIDFADEMTPLKEWTWDFDDYARAPGPPSAGRLRIYCWSNCKCKMPHFTTPSIRVLARVIAWKDGVTGYLTDPRPSEGSIQASIEDAEVSRTNTGCFKGFGCIVQGLYGGPLGSCKRNPILINAQETCQGSSASRHTSSCKDSCTSPRDCTERTSNECNYRPACLVRPATSLVLTDLSNVLTTWTTTQCMLKIKRHSRPRGKRSLGDMAMAKFQGRLEDLVKENTRRLIDMTEEEVEEKEMHDTNGYPCACNATYVSHACCHAGENGLVWEGPDLAMGRLEL